MKDKKQSEVSKLFMYSQLVNISISETLCIYSTLLEMSEPSSK